MPAQVMCWRERRVAGYDEQSVVSWGAQDCGHGIVDYIVTQDGYQIARCLQACGFEVTYRGAKLMRFSPGQFVAEGSLEAMLHAREEGRPGKPVTGIADADGVYSPLPQGEWFFPRGA